VVAKAKAKRPRKMKAKRRGLSETRYRYWLKRVKSGDTTWDELAQAGIGRPASRRGRPASCGDAEWAKLEEFRKQTVGS
jgi:hypothetical protein